MLEVRALAQATNVLRQAQDIRGGHPRAIIVLSMVGKTYRLTQDMKDAAAALELPLAKTAVTLKQIYADAPGQGAVVWRLGAAPATPPMRSTPCSAKCCPTPGRPGRRRKTAKRPQPDREGEESYGSTQKVGR